MTTYFDGFPFVLGWEVTLACNLRCRHCASRAGDPRPQELSLTEALAIADQLPALLVQEVVFTGGEPLLSPVWEPLARRLRKHKISVGMVTNAAALNQANVARLKKAGISGLAVSLDGLQETHDGIRGIPGFFFHVQEGIRRVLDAGFQVTVITTVSARSIGELPEMLLLLRQLGVKRWQLQPIFAFGRTSDNRDLQLTARDYLRLGQFVREMRPTAEREGIRLFAADGVGYFSEFDSDHPRWRGCSAGIATCGIMSDGRVKGCLSWPDTMVEGNLRDQTLWEIWFRDGAFASTRCFRKEDLAGACRDCEMGEECGGGCTAMSLAATGQMHADPYCFRTILSGHECGQGFKT
jgi:radical SAM protein with 4Fe4S-binding SPASM domain